MSSTVINNGITKIYNQVLSDFNKGLLKKQGIEMLPSQVIRYFELECLNYGYDNDLINDLRLELEYDLDSLLKIKKLGFKYSN
jgi:hypothetical protein